MANGMLPPDFEIVFTVTHCVDNKELKKNLHVLGDSVLQQLLQALACRRGCRNRCKFKVHQRAQYELVEIKVKRQILVFIPLHHSINLNQEPIMPILCPSRMTRARMIRPRHFLPTNR